ncbi:MAG TPA: multidrug ABC transporter ATP-binding protein, partial [Ramlibacter sp.]|nr:multidrug ABC transporter ATP-binding protein [Ramlibacter sp.]
MFRLFEKLLHPYPEAEPALPPKGFIAFVWACTRGLRGYIAGLALLSATIAAYEAWLFAVLGTVVDWLSRFRPDELWEQQRSMLTLFATVLVASTLLVAMQTVLKHQTLAINFPLRLRWNFHRLMLGQSMAFYSDEFAGRITTKVMQTGLA